MPKLLLIILYVSYVVSTSTPGSTPSERVCRSVPGSSGWPSDADWTALNQTTGGRLLAPNPPAIVCDPGRTDTYNKKACDTVGQNWGTAIFHTDDPVSVHYPNWQNDACLPTAVYNRTTSCNTAPFAYYVVNASEPEHVAEALKFANTKGVRLSVKATGHDFLGRSTGRGLAIWTRNIRGINILPSFQPTSCGGCSGVAAIQIFAGELFGSVYQQAASQGVIAVLGDDPSVGPGGYFLGGGHSPISTKFGLAVDNVLEMTAVLPTGEIITANAYQNQDLFWALRGGGGSSFAVLISATIRTFPDFQSAPFSIQFTSTKEEASRNDNKNFYSALAEFHLQIPHLTSYNLTGYNFARPTGIRPTGDTGKDPGSLINGTQTFSHRGKALGLTEDQTRSVLQPLWEKLNATKGITSNIKVYPPTGFYSSFHGSTLNFTSVYYPSGSNRVLGSRLWGLKALESKEKLISTFRKMQPSLISGLMISGPGVRNAANPSALSVTPAWRKSYYHIQCEAVWEFKNQKAQNEGIQRNNALTKALRDHAPDMGCYMNEADVLEPNFQQAFWGSNYKRLLQLKHQYDPNGVFYCNSCVGSEEWDLQSNGALCRKKAT